MHGEVLLIVVVAGVFRVAGLAVISEVTDEFAPLVAACEYPGADLADDLLARHGGVEQLEEEGPEECHRRVKVLAFGPDIGCFVKEVRRQLTAK